LRSEVRAQDELAVETAHLKTPVCLGDLIERDPPGNAQPDGASCQQAEEPLEVLPEPRGMAAALERRERAAIAVFADAIEATSNPPGRTRVKSSRR
jgi:hypothetical protein